MRRFFLFLLIFLACHFLPVSFNAFMQSNECCAGQLIFSWNSNDDPDVAGYKVYYGSESRKYTTTIDAGDTTTYSLAAIPAVKTYFAVTAYTKAGTESSFSDEAVYTPAPATTTAVAPTDVFWKGFVANWFAVSGVTSYYLDVATDSNFSTIVSGYENKNVGNVTSAAVSGLNPETTYYYRVLTSNSAGTSEKSNTIRAVTSAAPTAESLRNTPVLTSGDLNNDGSEDLIYISERGYVFYSTDVSSWALAGTDRFILVVCFDYDGDGYEDDLAGISDSGQIKCTSDHSSWELTTDRKFKQLVSFDYDEDGVKEALAGIDQSQGVYYSTGPDYTAWSGPIGTNKIVALAAGDFTSAGYSNGLAGVTQAQTPAYTTDLETWTKASAASRSLLALTAGDFDGDGNNNDMAAVSQNKYVLYTTDLNVWAKNTAQNFHQKTFKRIVAGKFNGDAMDDLAGITTSGRICYTTGLVSGAGWTRTGPADKKFIAITSGDFNNDGTDDLAAINDSFNVYYTTVITATVWSKIKKP